MPTFAFLYAPASLTGTPSTLYTMLPYHAYYYASKASAAVLMPAHHPRNFARLVSCYALFE